MQTKDGADSDGSDGGASREPRLVATDTFYAEDGYVLEGGRRFTIFLFSGSLPDRIHLAGVGTYGSESDSYCRYLAEEAERDTDGSEFDERVVANDSVGRPFWAKGAIVLVGSFESRRLHTALEECSIALECRYMVVPEEVASQVFVSMASMAEQGGSNRDKKRRKEVVNRMRSVTFDPDNCQEYKDHATLQRHMFFQEDLSLDEFPEDNARVSSEMHNYIKAKSVPWSFCFGGVKLEEERRDSQKLPMPSESATDVRAATCWLHPDGTSAEWHQQVSGQASWGEGIKSF